MHTFYKHRDVSKANIKDEIEKDWMSTTWSHPPTITSRVIPGAAISKPRCNNTLGVIRNTFIHQSNSPDSAIENGTGVRIPIPTNAAVELPSIPSLSSLSIKQFVEWLEILATISVKAKLPLRGRIAFWFQMLSTAWVEWWKCLSSVLGSFSIYKRANIGRLASAYSEQCLLVFLVAFASIAALTVF